MTVYTVVPEDDSNLDITVTDGEVITIEITPASLTATGAVESVNGETGVVVLTTSDLTNDSGYITADSTATLTNKSGNISQWTNDVGYLTSETDSQTLSFSNPNLSISNGNSVDLSALTPTSLDFSAITNTPTTISGYGITDAFDGAFSSLSGTPTTIAGYGITDAFSGDYDDLTNKPTLYTDSDVDAHLNTSTATTNQVLSWTGTDYDWVAQSGGGSTFDQDLNTTDDVEFASVTSDFYGPMHLNVQNDEGAQITAGTPVYFKGVSGNKITVGIADADDAAKMPAFGIATATANDGANVDIATSGQFVGFDTQTPGWSVNDSLYVSTTGTLTNTRPSGASEQVQKIARVGKVHSSSGVIYVMGAGRSNDIPNLGTNQVFVGNGSGYDVAQLSYTQLTDTPTDVSEFNNDAGYLTAITGTVTGSLIPNSNEAYDLGSSTYKFRDLYLSGSSIKLGDATITATGSAVALPTGSTLGGTAVSTFSGAYADLTGTPSIPSTLTDLGITDGTANQVLTTDGAGNFTFEDASGGGGASALGDLTDVSITSVQNNDLLKYNSTAGEWQNTNLGISLAPTVTTPDAFAGLSYTGTVTNHASYDQPAYFAEVYNSSGTKVVNNEDITFDGATFTIASGDMPSTGTNYELRIKAQDFGDLESEETTSTFDVNTFGGSFRYWRLDNFTGLADSGNRVMVANFRLHTGTGGGGGNDQPIYMTSNTDLSYTATASHTFSSTYAPYKAFDSNLSSTFWWNLGQSGDLTGDNSWIQIDVGSGNASLNIQSVTIRPGQSSYLFTGCTLKGSSTGAFAGEETEFVLTGISSTGTTIG